ncbi:MAG: vitamin K epoxide reductase family protein [Chloroflexota bacterium]
MRRVLVCVVLLLSLTVSLSVQAQAVENVEPIVQAVLFYSPTCPHCHKVITEDLPPLQEEYGERLQILGIDVSQDVGQMLYQDAITALKIDDNRVGVPTLVVGDVVLVGSLEIPELFPQIIADGMAAGGIGWPAIPSLAQVVTDLPPAAGPTAAAAGETAVTTTNVEPETSAAGEAEAVDIRDVDAAAMALEGETAVPDPVGFTLAWIVMVGMVISLAFVLMRFRTAQPYLLQTLDQRVDPAIQSWLVPALVLLGLVVASYLAYVEVQEVPAVCGPVGHCNVVQASPYARILGVPVAVLGLINYVAVGGLWLWQLARKQQNLAVYGLLALTVAGTFFSIYLTSLELFAIKAVCAWCLTSSVVTTLLMVVVVAALTKRPSPLNQPALG